MSEKIVLQNNKEKKSRETVASLASHRQSKENGTPADSEKLISTNLLSIYQLKLKAGWRKWQYCLWHWCVYSTECALRKDVSVAAEDHCFPTTRSLPRWCSPGLQAAGLSCSQPCAGMTLSRPTRAQLFLAVCFEGRVRREGQKEVMDSASSLLIYRVHAVPAQADHKEAGCGGWGGQVQSPEPLLQAPPPWI